MKYYNTATDSVETLGATVLIGSNNMYVSKLTTEQLVDAGYLPCTYESVPDGRYYSITGEISTVTGSTCTVSYSFVALDVEIIKTRMLGELSNDFKNNFTRPRVPTSLGFTVDGARDDILNFEDGKLFSLTTIKDADGVTHTVTSDDYDTIISEIKQYGLSMYQSKWTKEADINALTTVDECITYAPTIEEW